MGNSTISVAMFNSYVSHYQGVYCYVYSICTVKGWMRYTPNKILAGMYCIYSCLASRQKLKISWKALCQQRIPIVPIGLVMFFQEMATSIISIIRRSKIIHTSHIFRKVHESFGMAQPPFPNQTPLELGCCNPEISSWVHLFVQQNKPKRTK